MNKAKQLKLRNATLVAAAQCAKTRIAFFSAPSSVVASHAYKVATNAFTKARKDEGQ